MTTKSFLFYAEGEEYCDGILKMIPFFSSRDNSIKLKEKYKGDFKYFQVNEKKDVDRRIIYGIFQYKERKSKKSMKRILLKYRFYGMKITNLKRPMVFHFLKMRNLNISMNPFDEVSNMWGMQFGVFEMGGKYTRYEDVVNAYWSWYRWNFVAGVEVDITYDKWDIQSKMTLLDEKIKEMILSNDFIHVIKKIVFYM